MTREVVGAPNIAPGVAVEVRGGLAFGLRGVVLDRWTKGWGDVPLWRVHFSDTVCVRVLREDFLAVLP